MTTNYTAQQLMILGLAGEMDEEDRAAFETARAECEAFLAQYNLPATDENGPKLLGFAFALSVAERWLKNLEAGS